MNNITNMLSFDLEYWHSSEFLSSKYNPNSGNSDKELVEKPVIALLALLAKHSTKATFSK